MSDDWSAAERATEAGRLAGEQRQRRSLEAVWEYRLAWGHEPTNGAEAQWPADRARNVTPAPPPALGPSTGRVEAVTDEQRAQIDAAAARMGYVVEVIPERSCLERCMARAEAKYGIVPADVELLIREAHK